MKQFSTMGRGCWIVSLAATVAACGVGSARTAPAPAAEPLPPVISREVQPDPVPTLDAGCDNVFTVGDARPVTATTVAHYYIENGGLRYLVFVRGTPPDAVGQVLSRSPAAVKFVSAAAAAPRPAAAARRRRVPAKKK